MLLSPNQFKKLCAEQERIERKLSRIKAKLAAHFEAKSAQRRAKAAARRKEIQPPRAPLVNPDVAVVRAYAKEHFPHTTVFNSRRKNDRRVKIWKSLEPAEFKKHVRGLRKLLPDAKFCEAAPPHNFRETDKRCLCVVLPLEGSLPEG